MRSQSHSIYKSVSHSREVRIEGFGRGSTHARGSQIRAAPWRNRASRRSQQGPRPQQGIATASTGDCHGLPNRFVRSLRLLTHPSHMVGPRFAVRSPRSSARHCLRCSKPLAVFRGTSVPDGGPPRRAACIA
ncbi:hypothetical protein NJ7G_3640 [Natrinema sp. J7-2]|nr:hypothetical protein NJ7G_3640 [Natrinema sp. J7-2]